ncbi:hypothetical protein [Marinobacter sp. SS21]|uniref:hypothetical protein n=1 Tax=Marinobacter sp. SS21 TaxID=2979460 RepID=UPI00232E265C|nr:hypothetical protein [Marinobacter sp. SS21]MDC0662479.1 hypothetical protein [Marinobacter sp. SS21]
MKRRGGFRWLVLLLLLGIAGCVARGQVAPPLGGLATDCDVVFRDWQAQVRSADAADAQAWSPPGYPHLRVDRFLASFDLPSLSVPQRQAWGQRALALAIEAWEQEAESLDGAVDDKLAQLRHCGRMAMQRMLEQEDGWQHLNRAKAVPDSYRTAAQVLGLYPLVRPMIRWRAATLMAGLRAQFGRYQPQAPWQYYRPDVEPRSPLVRRIRAGPAPSPDALGIPAYSEVEAQRLLTQFAPTLAVETRDWNDQPGRPGRGLRGELRFLSQPVVFAQLEYTRLHDEVLPQLVYTVWFAARPSVAPLDIYAGALDGVVWRVTLGPDGRALIYDLMHACGCYHQWLLVAGGLVLRDDIVAAKDEVWILRTVPPTGSGVVLYLSAGEHQLVGVALEAASPDAEPYLLAPYHQLRGRSYAGGRLFDDAGMVAGSERAERWLLWPTGVPSAGAMRQWGRHAVSFTGRRHFDEPRLLERLFRLPRETVGGQ